MASLAALFLCEPLPQNFELFLDFDWAVEEYLCLRLLARFFECLEPVVVYASVFRLELLPAELSVFLIRLEVLRTEIVYVVDFAIPDIAALCLAQPLDSLAHLPHSKLGSCLLWAEVHA